PPLSSSVPFSRIRGIRSDTRFTFYRSGFWFEKSSHHSLVFATGHYLTQHIDSSQRLSILGTESSRILYGYAELMLETTD
ncbi:unnamed protein product, partial [Musa textilis]